LTLRLPDNGPINGISGGIPDLLLGPRDRSGPKRTGFGICAEDSAQALIAGAGPGSGDPLKGGAPERVLDTGLVPLFPSRADVQPSDSL